MPYCGTREELDEYLEDPDTTLLLLFDGQGRGEPIHDKAENEVTEAWRVALLCDDTSLLTAGERQKWSASDDGYVVLASPKSGTRPFVESGSLDALSLVKDGAPSILKIKQAFARGDQK